MLSSRRIALLGPLLAVVFAIGFAFSAAGQQATPQSQVQSADTRTFPALIHQRTCEQLGQTTYQLAPVGLPQVGQLVGIPAIPAYKSVTAIPNVKLDTFANGGYALAISKSDAEIDNVVACGLVGGTRYGDNLLFSIGPKGDPTFAGVVKMTQNQSGVTVTIHLIINPTGGATPVAASPAASSANGVSSTPMIGSSPVASNAGDQAQQGGQNQ